jgi:hypothetical protein
MGPITFLKLFTYAGDSSQSFSTDWISAPAEHKNALFVVEVKTRVGGSSSVSVQLQGSFDGDSVSSIGAPISTGAPGSSTVAISTGLYPMLRVNLSSASASMIVVLSVYLIPQIS